jgi:cytochrome c oxidase subunit 1
VEAVQPPDLAPQSLVNRLHGWITTVDHKRLGIMYILYALMFLVEGGIKTTIMRIQLIVPHNNFVSPQVFNRMFTMHGTTMIFRGHAHRIRLRQPSAPADDRCARHGVSRLNAFSFWMTAFGGCLLYFSCGALRPLRRGKRPLTWDGSPTLH